MSYTERLPSTAVTMSEQFDGTLPPLDQLAFDFHDRLVINERVAKGIRINLAMRNARRVRDSLLDVAELANPPRDQATLLYLDAICLMGESFFSDRRLLDEKAQKRPRNFEQTHKVMAERERFQTDLAVFDDIFADADSETKYQAIEALVYDATCLIADKTDLSPHANGRTRAELVGLLAEYKVYKALRDNGFPFTFFSTPEVDYHESTDIVVPIGPWQNREFVSIQVKSRSNRQDRFALSVPSGILHVEVPMHRSLDQLNLAEPEKDELLSTVFEAAVKVAPSFSYN